MENIILSTVFQKEVELTNSKIFTEKYANGLNPLSNIL